MPTDESRDRTNTRTYMIAIGLAILTFFTGGTITVLGITVENPWQDQIRNQLIEDDYVFRRMESFHAVTSVLTVVKQGGGLSEATLTGVSTRAANFFGFEAAHMEESLIGKAGGELAKILKPYMDKEDYENFRNDQADVFEHYGDGKLASAKIPVIFNESHRYYKNEVFLPIIVSLGEKTKESDGTSRRLIQIAYFNVKELVPAVKKYMERMESKRN